jgi:hypothetical protein
MKTRILITGTTLALAGWFALAHVSMLEGASLPRYQVAQNERYEGHEKHARHHHSNTRDDEWYQGQRGRWHRERNDNWQWRGAEGDEWYQGQRGHWYQERNGWQFGSDGMVCGAQGRNCRKGGYVPANGQGMVNAQNPNLYWACDSEGHHCHWARRR